MLARQSSPSATKRCTYRLRHLQPSRRAEDQTIEPSAARAGSCWCLAGSFWPDEASSRRTCDHRSPPKARSSSLFTIVSRRKALTSSPPAKRSSAMRIRSSIRVAISSRAKLTAPPASVTARRDYALARTCSTSSFRKARTPPGRSTGRSRPRRTSVMNCFGLISDSRNASAGESRPCGITSRRVIARRRARTTFG